MSMSTCKYFCAAYYINVCKQCSFFQALTLIYRKMVTNYGLWDQLRVDHGKEWYLMLYIQETLSHLRNDASKPPHTQSSSTLVNKVDYTCCTCARASLTTMHCIKCDRITRWNVSGSRSTTGWTTPSSVRWLAWQKEGNSPLMTPCIAFVFHGTPSMWQMKDSLASFPHGMNIPSQVLTCMYTITCKE